MAILSQYFTKKASHLAVQRTKMSALKVLKKVIQKYNAKKWRFCIDLKLSQKKQPTFPSILLSFKRHQFRYRGEPKQRRYKETSIITEYSLIVI